MIGQDVSEFSFQSRGLSSLCCQLMILVLLCCWGVSVWCEWILLFFLPLWLRNTNFSGQRMVFTWEKLYKEWRQYRKLYLNLSVDNWSSVSCLITALLTLGERAGKIFRKGWIFCTGVFNLDLPAIRSVSKFVSHVFFIPEMKELWLVILLKMSGSITFMKTLWIFYCFKIIMINSYFAIQGIT